MPRSSGVNLRPKLDCYVDVSDYSSLSEAIDNIGSNKKTLLIQHEQFVDVDQEIPSNITLLFLRCGALNIARGRRVIVNGPVRAERHHIFKGWRNITLGQGAVSEIFPEWWGIGQSADEIAVNKAINAAQDGMQISISQDLFLSDSININKQIVMRGYGYPKITQGTPNKAIIKVTNNNVRIESLQFYGEGSFHNTDKTIRHFGDAIRIGDGRTSLSNITVQDCIFENSGDLGIIVDGDPESLIKHVTLRNLKIVGNDTYHNLYNGIRIESGQNISVVDCDISGFGNNIITTGDSHYIDMIGCKLHHASKNNGIYLSGGSEHVTISACEIHNNKVTIKTVDADGREKKETVGTGIKTSAPHTTIIGNRIYNNGSWGINLKADLHDILINGNSITYNENSGIDAGFEKSGRTQERIIISGNTISNNGGHGIDMAYDEPGCTWRDIVISQNVFSDNTGKGIKLRAASSEFENSTRRNLVISNNICSKNGGGVLIGGRKEENCAENIIFSGNLLVDNGGGGRRDEDAQLVFKHARKITASGNMILAQDPVAPVYSGVYCENVKDLYWAESNVIEGHASKEFAQIESEAGYKEYPYDIEIPYEAYTLTKYDRLLCLDTTGNDVTVICPKPESLGHMPTVTIKVVTEGPGHEVHIVPDSDAGSLIDEEKINLVNQYDFVTLKGYGNQWYVIAKS